jgi:formylglycine-generating enzyme required for sulfatase activity
MAIAARDGYAYTAPVGRFRANAFGLFDMHGNVGEWCWDGHQDDYYKASPGADPSGPPQASFRISRGGDWFSDLICLRSAHRHKDSPADRSSRMGFRVARDGSGR